jgi:hypothetical protein
MLGDVNDIFGRRVQKRFLFKVGNPNPNPETKTATQKIQDLAVVV